MINSELPAETTADERVDRIVAEGPHGALTVAGIATVIVLALWFAFYLFVFLPRGSLQ
jgi:cytochrome c oxidase subunit IIa family protein